MLRGLFDRYELDESNHRDGGTQRLVSSYEPMGHMKLILFFPYFFTEIVLNFMWTVDTLIRRHGLRRPFMVRTVCLCPLMDVRHKWLEMVQV